MVVTGCECHPQLERQRQTVSLLSQQVSVPEESWLYTANLNKEIHIKVCITLVFSSATS